MQLTINKDRALIFPYCLSGEHFILSWGGLRFTAHFLSVTPSSKMEINADEKSRKSWIAEPIPSCFSFAAKKFGESLWLTCGLVGDQSDLRPNCQACSFLIFSNASQPISPVLRQKSFQFYFRENLRLLNYPWLCNIFSPDSQSRAHPKDEGTKPIEAILRLKKAFPAAMGKQNYWPKIFLLLCVTKCGINRKS